MKNGKTNSVKCFLPSFLTLSRGMCARRSACGLWPVIHLRLPTLLEARLVGLKMITLPGVLRIPLSEYGLYSCPLLWKHHEAPSYLSGPCPGRGSLGHLPPTPRTGCFPVIPDFVPQACVLDVKSRHVLIVQENLCLAGGGALQATGLAGPLHLCGPLKTVSPI